MLAETQPLQDDAAWSRDLYGKTQLLEAWDEKAAVDDAGGETEALSQDEQGASHDGVSCSDQGDGVSGERKNGGWVDPDASTDDEPDGVNGEGKEDTWVDPDASTDDEAGQVFDLRPVQFYAYTAKISSPLRLVDSSDRLYFPRVFYFFKLIFAIMPA